ncbi:MAG: DEAD/DEAH box helicase, partial [Chloroflexota bacterium]
MDILALRDQVVDDYRAYFESFVNIADPRLDAAIRREFARGTLWPDAVLQLNPAYVQRRSLRELAHDGVILEDTAHFFGPELRLHQHQEEALLIAQRGEPYVVSTGTGSGKSLTYLLPIVDGIFRRLQSGESATGVQGLIVYPMNALINSQETALQEYAQRNWPDCPLRFRKYTGEVKREARNEIVENPPHVLLTNYVMLEYLLLRAAERSLLRQATRDLRFLIVDELHFYRGRQGADVAMLLRRVRERAGRPDLVLAGTSATIAAAEGLDHAERRRQIAGVASTLFGVPVPAGNVVEETLRRVTTVAVPASPEEMDEALRTPPAPTPGAVAAHPLAAWVESYFGITEENGRFVRQRPRTFQSGLDELTRITELDEAFCRQALQATLDAGNRAITSTGDPVFPFRLHQFYASGGSVYTTIEPAETRRITTSGQYTTPDGAQLYPVAFCRDCGQEYYLCAQGGEDGGARLAPRTPSVDDPVDPSSGTAGYFALDHEATVWPGEDALPEWWYTRARTPSIRTDLRRFVPIELWVAPTGEIHQVPQLGTVRGWFTAHPLRICLRCRATYDLRSREFAKLATLSQTGRSTATTVVASGAVVALRQDATVDPDAHKVLSFTDTRQDAPLQAGHLNDFVAVALLRGALARALARHGPLRLGDVGRAAFDALELEPTDFMGVPVPSGPGYDRARAVMMDLLEYRAIEDLRWSGRVTFPNLERTGLLRVRYTGLDELVDDARWRGVQPMETASPERRHQILEDVLDYLRSELAIEAECLKPDAARSLIPRTRNNLREPWIIQERGLRRQRLALLPGAEDPSSGDDSPISLGYRSRIGAYLRRADTLRESAAPEPHPLDTTAGESLAVQIVERLTGHLLSEVRAHGHLVGVRVNADVLIWERGAGVPPPPNRVRLRDAMRRNLQELRREPNPYFRRLYAERSRQLVGVTGQPHTGAVPYELRQQREDDFKNGRLAALFCSPTMELGVDIRDLVVVHMRNVPRSPANYAQRSGRAGRGGRPALVLTFCAEGNAHDQYFFHRKERMISGSVNPPRIDLANVDLVEAHLHSVWLAATGVGLENSIGDVLDLDDPALPVRLDIRNQFDHAATLRAGVIERFRSVCGGEGDLAAAPWLTDSWLEQVVTGAPDRFDRAFDRWRTLYRDAVRLRDEARRIIDRHRVAPDERDAATQREREARRELELLLNQTSRQTDTQTETDSY